MSVTKTCLCDRSNYRVEHRNHNHSYFETPKGLAHYSDYSGIRCLACGWRFRTKARWVLSCPDITEDEWDRLLEENPAPNVGYSVSIQSWDNRLKEGRENV